MKKHEKVAIVGTALAMLITPAWAEIVVNEKIDMNFLDFVPCANGGTGELVNLSGPLHVLITANINGNRISGKTHYQPQGVSGTGQITGDTYQGVGVTQSHFSGSFINGLFSQTLINNFRIIGHGTGSNYRIHDNFHITFNANGEVTTSHDNFTIDCR